MKNLYQNLLQGLLFSALVLQSTGIQAQWSTATLSRARTELGAASADGKAFFAGGFSPATGNLRVVDIYDTATNTWLPTINLSLARSELGATSVGGKVFFAGGFGTTYSNVVDIYDTSTSTWLPTAALSQARRTLSATSAGGKAFFGGGFLGSASNVVDIYDTATNTWSATTLSQPRTDLSAASAGGKVFFAGGFNTGHSNVVDIYDTATNSWLPPITLSQARSQLSATSVGSKVFFGGGIGNSGYSNVVDIYDTATNSWLPPITLSQARYRLSATSAGGKVFFAGGRGSDGNPSAVVDIYDTVTNTWLPTTALSQARRYLAATSAGGKAFFAGGFFGSTYSNVVDIYTTVPPLTATKSQVDLLCNGVCNGSATVMASGGVPPYTYSWSPSGGNAATASSLCAGDYTVTIMDGVGTIITKDFTITQPPALTATPSQTNVTCNGGSNGAASVSVGGGTPGYTYDWSPGNPTGDGTNAISGLTAGSYSVLITDNVGCTKTISFTITQPDAVVPVITANGTTTFCQGGSVSLSTTASFSNYVWKKGDESVGGDASYLATTSGNYTVTVTDASSCSGTSAPVTVTVNPLPTVSLSALAPSYCQYALPSSPGTPAGGSYSVDGGPAQNSFNPANLSVGSHTVVYTYTDPSTQCSNSATQLVSIQALSFTNTPTVSGVPVCAGSAVTVNFSTNGCPASSLFSLQLSNASGSFTGAVTPLGSFPSGTSSVTIPGSIPAGSSYRIRVVSAGGGPVSNPGAAFRIRSCSVASSRLAAEAPEGLQVGVSPNPTPGLLGVSVRGVMGQTLRLELYNAAGQVVRQQLVETAQAEESLSWDISRQPQGLYLLRVSSEYEAKTVKVVH